MLNIPFLMSGEINLSQYFHFQVLNEFPYPTGLGGLGVSFGLALLRSVIG